MESLVMEAHESEKAVLGAMLRDPLTTPYVFDRLVALDFDAPRCREVFRLIERLDEEHGHAPDVVTVAHNLDGNATRSDLEQMMLAMPASGTLDRHVEEVKRGSALRRLASMSRIVAQHVEQAGADPVKIAESVEESVQQILMDLREEASMLAHDHGQRLVEQVRKAASMEAPPRTALSTSIVPLNDLLAGGGLDECQLVIVAGRPGEGKTSLAQDFAEAASLEGPVLWFTLEMPPPQLIERYFVRQCGRAASSPRLRCGAGATRWLETTQAAQMALGRHHLYLCGDARIEPSRVRAMSRKMKRQGGLRLVIIDYLQLMSAPNLGKSANREQQVAAITRSLKLTANELRIPIVLLAQLNRQPAGRQDQTPRLTDLRESGAIEQDADVVIFCHDDALVLAKQRNGPTDAVPAVFDRERFRWTSPPMPPPSAWME